MTESWHGTPGGYNNHKCRCKECRAAWLASCKEQEERRREKGLKAGDPRHGTYYGYRGYGCRCLGCTQANRDNRRNQREGTNQ